MTRDQDHLKFIRTLPCVTSGKVDGIESAHIRMHGDAGMGIKPPDSRVVPLFHMEHKRQHQIGEARFWGNSLVEAIDLAENLYRHTGDREKCIELIVRFRHEQGF